MMARIVEESYIEDLCQWIKSCDEHCEITMSRVLAEVKADLENMPQVVCCKDCEYNKYGGCRIEWEIRQDSEDWNKQFCSEGKRRKDAKE